jgi:hypothetical protein
VQNYITHPYASPLFGDLTGLPPLLIQCGDAEVLRDEGTLFAHKASLAGVDVHHEVYADCPHVFQAFIFLDATRQALQNARAFVKNVVLAHHEPVSMDPSSIDKELLADAHAVNDDAELEPTSLPSADGERQPPHVHSENDMGRSVSGGLDNELADDGDLGWLPPRRGSRKRREGGRESGFSEGEETTEEEEEVERGGQSTSLSDRPRTLSAPSLRTTARTAARSKAQSFLEAWADAASQLGRRYARSQQSAEERAGEGQRHDREGDEDLPSPTSSAPPPEWVTESGSSSGARTMQVPAVPSYSRPLYLQMSAAGAEGEGKRGREHSGRQRSQSNSSSSVSLSEATTAIAGSRNGGGGEGAGRERQHKRSSTASAIQPKPDQQHQHHNLWVRTRSSSHPELRAMVEAYHSRGQHQSTTLYRSSDGPVEEAVVEGKDGVDSGSSGSGSGGGGSVRRVKVLGEVGGARTAPSTTEASTEDDDDEDPYLEFSTTIHHNHNNNKRQEEKS